MRNMSFSLTSRQIMNRTKTVTRRTGWGFLKPGDLVQACEKCMGLKKGQKIRKLAVIRIKSVEFEKLSDVRNRPGEMRKEGFPGWHPDNFILMFLKSHKDVANSGATVTRIEFEYVD